MVSSDVTEKNEPKSNSLAQIEAEIAFWGLKVPVLGLYSSGT